MHDLKRQCKDAEAELFDYPSKADYDKCVIAQNNYTHALLEAILATLNTKPEPTQPTDYEKPAEPKLPRHWLLSWLYR